MVMTSANSTGGQVTGGDRHPETWENCSCPSAGYLHLTLATFSLFPRTVRGFPQELEDVLYRTEGCGSR